MTEVFHQRPVGAEVPIGGGHPERICDVEQRGMKPKFFSYFEDRDSFRRSVKELFNGLHGEKDYNEYLVSLLRDDSHQ